MKVRLTVTQIPGGQKNLLRRIQDKGRVEGSPTGEREIFLHPPSRDLCVSFPVIRFLDARGLHAGNGLRLAWRRSQSTVENTGPPGTIGSEVELEIGWTVGKLEKELGNIVSPELCLKHSWFAIGMREAFPPFLSCEEVKVFLVQPKKKGSRMFDDLSIPIGRYHGLKFSKIFRVRRALRCENRSLF